MGIYSNIMKTARSLKHSVSAMTAKPVCLSPVRRIGHVATKQRICAMTFDDGPCLLPPSERPGGDSLTLELISTLEKYGAFGTFDVVGDTSGNYPDKAGRDGTASWGGIRYDHYPDIDRDKLGGAGHSDDLVRRILDGGHALANHGWAHVLFGRKSLVYGRRAFFRDIGAVLDDLGHLHSFIKDEFGYEIRLARPPHYVDVIPDDFTSYDAYAKMGYTYMAADFDGAGWLPLSSYKEEVDAMVSPMERLLAENPDALCGQIIFQKDGFNMARRTPVADGLPLQLELLDRYGYKVLTVPDLLAASPFSDIFDDDPTCPAASALIQRGNCVAYRDNTLRPDSVCTRGEFYIMMHGREVALERIEARKPLPRSEHPYLRAAQLAKAPDSSSAALDSPLDAATLDAWYKDHYGLPSGLSGSALPRKEVIAAICYLTSATFPASSQEFI